MIPAWHESVMMHFMSQTVGCLWFKRSNVKKWPSRRGWTFFFWGGVKFFEVLKKKRGSIRSERQRDKVWSETQKWRKKSLFLKHYLISGIEINWNLHFHSLPLFPLAKLIHKCYILHITDLHLRYICEYCYLLFPYLGNDNMIIYSIIILLSD